MLLASSSHGMAGMAQPFVGAGGPATFALPGGALGSASGPGLGQAYSNAQQLLQPGLVPHAPSGPVWSSGPGLSGLDGLGSMAFGPTGMDALPRGPGRAPSPDVLQSLSLTGLQGLSGLLSGLGISSSPVPLGQEQAGGQVGFGAGAGLAAALNPNAGEFHPPGPTADGTGVRYGPAVPGGHSPSHGQGPAAAGTPSGGARRLPVFATLDQS